MAAPEVPDWTRPVSVMGQDSEGNPVTVLLDSLGRLICVLYGAVSISGDVNVTQESNVREIQGAEGVSLHTIAVDSEGRIIALIKGMYDSTPTNVAVDASGQMITVPRGQSGNYLLVDSDGFMATLMKAIYAGTTLKTVACDEQGRMIMIPTDPADVWGNAISMGNAELVARLTGMGGFDRRGNAIYLTSFENGLVGWATSAEGTGGSISLSTTTSKNGVYSVKMIPGSDGTRLADLTRYIPYPSVSKVGLEVSFTVHGNMEYFYIHFVYCDGTNYYAAAVRYDEALIKFQYYNSAEVWTDLLTSKDLVESIYAFHTAKLVIDLSAKEYVRFLVDNSVVSMSGYGIKATLNAAAPILQPLIRVTADAGTNPSVYVDGIIITVNEPANV